MKLKLEEIEENRAEVEIEKTESEAILMNLIFHQSNLIRSVISISLTNLIVFVASLVAFQRSNLQLKFLPE